MGSFEVPDVLTSYCDVEGCELVGRHWLLGDGRSAMRTVILCAQHVETVPVREAYRLSSPATTQHRKPAPEAPQPRRQSLLSDLPLIEE